MGPGEHEYAAGSAAQYTDAEGVAVRVGDRVRDLDGPGGGGPEVDVDPAPSAPVLGGAVGDLGEAAPGHGVRVRDDAVIDLRQAAGSRGVPSVKVEPDSLGEDAALRGQRREVAALGDRPRGVVRDPLPQVDAVADGSLDGRCRLIGGHEGHDRYRGRDGQQ
jgi:hypothetical protein